MTEDKKTKFCPGCGGEIDAKAKICPQCGVEQPLIIEKVSSSWYFLSIFLGIVGGIVAWAVNKDRDPKKAVRFLIVGLIFPFFLAIIGVLVSTFLVSLGGTKNEAKDASVMASMSQLRLSIEMYNYSYSIDGYSGIGCSSPGSASYCNDIEEMAGEKPTIKFSEENYCFYVRLPSGGYCCVTDSSSPYKTTVFPGKLGYCDGTTFICP
jgi:type II secretory pathway pseudopilin PulG